MGSSVATYVGQNYGAGEIERINKGINQAMTISVALALVSGVIVYFGSDLLTGLFVKNPSKEMLSLSKNYLFWQGVFYIGLAIIYVYRNGLQGMGYSVLTMAGGVVELLMRIVASIFLVKVLGYLGLCLSNPCAWLGVDVLFLTSYYIIIHRKCKRLPRVSVETIKLKKHSKGIAG